MSLFSFEFLSFVKKYIFFLCAFLIFKENVFSAIFLKKHFGKKNVSVKKRGIFQRKKKRGFGIFLKKRVLVFKKIWLKIVF